MCLAGATEALTVQFYALVRVLGVLVSTVFCFLYRFRLQYLWRNTN